MPRAKLDIVEQYLNGWQEGHEGTSIHLGSGAMIFKMQKVWEVCLCNRDKGGHKEFRSKKRAMLYIEEHA